TFTKLVQNKFIPTVQTAITNYNQQALISTLPCPNTRSDAVNNGSTNTQAGNIAVIQNDKGNIFRYTLGEDHNLYQIDDQYSLVNKLSLPDIPQFTAIASANQHLLALSSVPGKGNAPPTYSLNLLAPQASGTLSDVYKA